MKTEYLHLLKCKKDKMVSKYFIPKGPLKNMNINDVVQLIKEVKRQINY